MRGAAGALLGLKRLAQLLRLPRRQPPPPRHAADRRAPPPGRAAQPRRLVQRHGAAVPRGTGGRCPAGSAVATAAVAAMAVVVGVVADLHSKMGSMLAITQKVSMGMVSTKQHQQDMLVASTKQGSTI